MGLHGDHPTASPASETKQTFVIVLGGGGGSVQTPADFCYSVRGRAVCGLSQDNDGVFGSSCFIQTGGSTWFSALTWAAPEFGLHGGIEGFQTSPACSGIPPPLTSCLALQSPPDFAEPWALLRHTQITPPTGRRCGEPVSAPPPCMGLHCRYYCHSLGKGAP